MKRLKSKPERLFTDLNKGLSDLNFDKLTEQQKKRERKIVGYRPPEGLPRIIETAPQVEYRKIIGEYTIKILTSYREDRKNFTKAGKIWCHILGPKVDVGLDTKYTRIIFRRGEFIKKTLQEAEFLVYALNHRPMDSKNRPMNLKEEPRGFFNWVSVSNEKEKINFYHAIPPNIIGEIRLNKRKREYYIQKVRDRLGIKSWARDNRKVGTKDTANNAVPVAI